jgi:hypothetical protein
MNGFREKIKDFGHRLYVVIVTEEAVEHGRVLIMPQREKKLKHGTGGRTMRLIDADDVKKMPFDTYEKEKDVISSYWVAGTLADKIDEVQTAYDVDKVVEQLDEYIVKIVGRKSALYQNVMQIVKAGGVNVN